MANTHTYSLKEEIANAITHGIGVLLSIAALVLLIVYASMNGTPMHIVTFAIYGATMLLLYLNSTILHSLPHGKAKNLFEIFDHSSIYLFIAGTYTPIVLTVIKGAVGWWLFGIVWGFAIFGVAFKAFFVKRFLYTSTLVYVLMGWIIVFAWDSLVRNLSPSGVVLLVMGGVLYSLGAIFYVWRGFPFHHAVWHLFVLAGSAFHFFAILFLVL
ncbi:Hemolysin-3 [[Clostridium] ultunense Esp]|uniref:PAQR family membrane homeostasis protein TrhA n=1 Tax=Thermicanus aegyptius TaxID=94009 RepID=UPI0002B6F213|nr:hemolysin III family protein [Thermicanus aegyptius]CCQ96288.1 Hemolysin-3 [[Clostridium] ultunense Esp]